MTGLPLYLAIAALAFPTPAPGANLTQDCATHTTAAYQTLPVQIVGKANPDNCTIQVDPSGTPAERCTTAVHEYGHLLGYQHSQDPDSVMYPERVRVYWRCRYRWRLFYADALEPLQ